ncbi:membrane hypothetical protein [Clostridium neonatale]|uniref:Uncharacterized protein n=1 Tax=Clostridium neonatale TaxID=137838 RepID=A0AAD2DHJ5_9CLOT|nr:membrane hypothetical protein [Clostridium neonatale]CAI3214039.1 membrane hypothetical protein [Clostridium neonatale]CAI3216197.1 membrane hypothetical protein [Clostridium neonatale]CAI3216742.1 membrane hypothetical protein [Clostridium neonatale]CAI3249321.1 membrane hypothetical protein [Clostridium neonatale]
MSFFIILFFCASILVAFFCEIKNLISIKKINQSKKVIIKAFVNVLLLFIFTLCYIFSFINYYIVSSNSNIANVIGMLAILIYIILKNL